MSISFYVVRSGDYAFKLSSLFLTKNRAYKYIKKRFRNVSIQDNSFSYEDSYKDLNLSRLGIIEKIQLTII